MSYATLPQFKAFLRIAEEDTVDDAEMQRALDTATSEINHMCSRTFEVADGLTTRYFLPWWDRRNGAWVLPIDDVQDPTDLAVNAWTEDDTAWTTPVTGWQLRPLNVTQTRPYSSLLLPSGSDYSPGSGWAAGENSAFLAVTARWGWGAIPAPIVEACLIQADRVFKRRDAVFGVTSSPDGSENTRLTNTVDVDAQVALRGFVKYWAAK